MISIRTSIVAVAATATLMIGTGACSSGSGSKVATLNDNGSSSSSSSSGSKQDFRDAMLDYSKCMRDHDIDIPDPTFTDNGDGGGTIGMVAGGPGGKGPDPDSAAFKTAQTACQPILDAAEKDVTPPSPEEQAKMRDQALEFAQCMRDHGVDMPDPTFDGDGKVSIEVHGPDGGSDASGGTITSPGAGPAADPAFQEASKACASQTGGPLIGGAGPASSK